MSCPYISVLTVASERQQGLAATAQALQAQSLAHERFEWVVCLTGDGGDRQEALGALDLPFVVRPFEADPTRPPGAARNACASRTCGSILLFAEVGWLPASGSLAAHVAIQEAGLCIAVERARPLLRRLGRRGPRPGAWSVPASIFRSVGGFDEGAPGIGRAERRLERRLRKAGLATRAVHERTDRGRDGGDGESDYATMEDTA